MAYPYQYYAPNGFYYPPIPTPTPNATSYFSARHGPSTLPSARHSGPPHRTPRDSQKGREPSIPAATTYTGTTMPSARHPAVAPSRNRRPPMAQGGYAFKPSSRDPQTQNTTRRSRRQSAAGQYHPQHDWEHDECPAPSDELPIETEHYSIPGRRVGRSKTTGPASQPPGSMPSVRELLSHDPSSDPRRRRFLARLNKDIVELRESHSCLFAEYQRPQNVRKRVDLFTERRIDWMSDTIKTAELSPPVPFDALINWGPEENRQFCESVALTQESRPLQKEIVEAYTALANFGMSEDQRLDATSPFHVMELAARSGKHETEQAMSASSKKRTSRSGPSGVPLSKILFMWDDLLGQIARARVALDLPSASRESYVSEDDGDEAEGGDFWVDGGTDDIPGEESDYEIWSTSTKPVIAVAFYSTYGHIETLAEAIIEGARSAGAEVRPYFIRETLPKEVLDKMYAGSSLSPKYPVLTPNDLKEVDGLILGAPTRYGRVPAQVSAFFDECGGLWASGGLVGKFAATFTSSGGQHGGQETTALTTMPFFTHLMYVPLGYTHPYVNDYAKNEIHGGSPWGVSTVVGSTGERSVLPEELELARHQGKSFAETVGTFVRGKTAIARERTQGQGNASVASPTADAHRAVPAKTTSNTAVKDEGFAVPPTASAEPAVPKPAQSPTPAAPTAGAPVKPTQPKAKGGFFSCCGAKGIDP